ncbi:alkaline phosphatase [Photobacterium sp. DNB23_23_1]
MNYKLSAMALATSLILTGCMSSSDSNTDGGSNPLPKPTTAKNVILMISDGASDGAWDIASFYTHGQMANEVAPLKDMPHRYAMTTYPLNQSLSPPIFGGCNDSNTEDVLTPKFTYDPEKAWSDKRVDDPEARRMFEGYEYLDTNWTDSAAAGTAMATGTKTYINGISVDGCGDPLKLITEYAKDAGKSTGVVTSVNLAHATPAVFGTKDTTRLFMNRLTSGMLSLGHLDLIMGAGHPDYDDDGVRTDSPNFATISEDDWASVTSGLLFPAGSELPWGFMDTLSQFEALAGDYAAPALMEGPLLAIPQVKQTLQQRRTCTAEERMEAFACKEIPDMPTLEMMTKGALNYLGQNENGFFVMIEGGAVDWAAHDNDTGLIIEEQTDFHDSISAVMEWVETNSNWDETLLVITTDHGNSYVLGETSDLEAYAPVNESNVGTTPEVKYYSGDHTAELVRVYAKGFGATRFEEHFDGNDPYYADKYRNEGATGEYFDNTNIFDVMKSVMFEAVNPM